MDALNVTITSAALVSGSGYKCWSFHTLMGWICSPESDNWAQPQTPVALDAELVGKSLLHEND